MLSNLLWKMKTQSVFVGYIHLLKIFLLPLLSQLALVYCLYNQQGGSKKWFPDLQGLDINTKNISAIHTSNQIIVTNKHHVERKVPKYE